MPDIKDPFDHKQEAKKQVSSYFPEIPVKQELLIGEDVRLGQRDILPTQIVDRLLGTGAVVLHALNDPTVHSGNISDTQHGARGTINHAHHAADIDYHPAGAIAATDVQAALTELDTEKSATGHNHDHATLTNLNSADYTHLTATNATDLTDGGNTTLHTHDIYMPKAGGTFTGDITMTGGENIILGTSTGTMIGTATNQLLGFYGKTPVDQPATVSDAATQVLTGTDTVDITKLTNDLTSCKNAINAIIDRLQELGLIA